MLGKGAKRKLDEDEDGLEGKALALGGAADAPSKVSYTLQRQTIFNISLMKLYNQRAPTEPSLERRVLINNVLRRIQEELTQEGSLRPLFFPPSAPPDDPVDEGFREAQPAFGMLSVAAAPPPQPPPAPPPSALSDPAPPDSCLTPASLLEDDASSFCTLPSPHAAQHYHGLPRPPPLVAKDSFSSALDEIEELCPTTTTTTTSSSAVPAPHLPALPHSPSVGADAKDCSRACSQKFEGLVSQLESRVGVAAAAESRLMDSLPPSSLDMSSSCSAGFLTDLALDDILFADIDTSMYDFDPCTSASGTSASKMAPVVTADDLLKTLSPYGGSPPSVTPNQPFKMDLTELDHIMEVLVGS
ncbi:SERTA domain-containing protein 2b [Megalops cyprinoides]|uniref:SERTA domain-containing protein 2b n=1 Tax=Megalops cyprinoides TaxID=118141 RepID=UPI001864D8E9|nr:SERTA domain-containing protein 2b [Megalops cyprinoides]XP_036402668.1 SERTA domain-containing protein 2b [Megalops cyprinoides]